MPEDFKQTVNLRERMKKEPQRLREKVNEHARQIIKDDAKINREEAIDRVYNDLEDAERDLKKISRPAPWVDREILYRRIIIILFLFVIGFGTYLLFFGKNKNVVNNNEEKNGGWYSVKLINGEIYYGEIANTSADPVVLKNVYYNYDQINPATAGTEKKEESASLRLVKRGNEAHGPDGNMEIVRTQVVIMEPLKEDSKVLKAILDYEK